MRTTGILTTTVTRDVHEWIISRGCNIRKIDKVDDNTVKVFYPKTSKNKIKKEINLYHKAVKELVQSYDVTSHEICSCILADLDSNLSKVVGGDSLLFDMKIKGLEEKELKEAFEIEELKELKKVSKTISEEIKKFKKENDWVFPWTQLKTLRTYSTKTLLKMQEENGMLKTFRNDKALDGALKAIDEVEEEALKTNLGIAIQHGANIGKISINEQKFLFKLIVHELILKKHLLKTTENPKNKRYFSMFLSWLGKWNKYIEHILCDKEGGYKW